MSPAVCVTLPSEWRQHHRHVITTSICPWWALMSFRSLLPNTITVTRKAGRAGVTVYETTLRCSQLSRLTQWVRWLHHSWILIAEILTPSLPWRDVAWKWPIKMRNLRPVNLSGCFSVLVFSVFSLPLVCGRTFTNKHNIDSRCYRTGKYTVCRRVRASFSPEILQAGAVKGSMKLKRLTQSGDCTTHGFWLQRF